VIDLHCHVLPGIDDGPPSLEDALALARAAAEAGTKTIVATPHVSWDWPENDAARIAAAVDAVNTELLAQGIDLEVRPGAEVAMTRAADLTEEELRALHLGGGPYLLVECPHSPAASGFEGLLSALAHAGHGIVLAHPERCPAFHRDRTTLERLVGNGMLSSITAGSLSGRFGRQVRTFAHEMLRDGLVHNVASDAHDLTRRPPGTDAILAQEGLGDGTDWLTRQVPLAVLDGGRVPPPPVMTLPETERGGLLGRLFRRAS
jgi:protein-tyrosine phosphatase